jgi:hypothetical protein
MSCVPECAVGTMRNELKGGYLMIRRFKEWPGDVMDCVALRCRGLALFSRIMCLLLLGSNSAVGAYKASSL